MKANLATGRASQRRYSGTFAEFRTAATPLFEYDRQVAALEEAFGWVTVHRFEDGDVVGAMYGHLGIAPRRALDSAAPTRVLTAASCFGSAAPMLAGRDRGRHLA